MIFECTKCDICCRNIDKIPELSKFHTGDGACIYLSDENLCKIYLSRPDICNVEKMYETYYKRIMSKEEYVQLNMEGCRVLQNISKIGDSSCVSRIQNDLTIRKE